MPSRKRGRGWFGGLRLAGMSPLARGGRFRRAAVGVRLTVCKRLLSCACFGISTRVCLFTPAANSLIIIYERIISQSSVEEGFEGWVCHRLPSRACSGGGVGGGGGDGGRPRDGVLVVEGKLVEASFAADRLFIYLRFYRLCALARSLREHCRPLPTAGDHLQ